MDALTKKLEQEKNKLGLVGTSLRFSRPKKGNGISEHITSDWREVVISVREDVQLVPDKETEEYIRKLGIDNPLECLAIDLLWHGCGHREVPTYSGLGCPRDIFNHDKILDGVAEALQKKKKHGLECYVANAFEDILDNVNVRQHRRHAGQVIFWNNSGLESQGKFPAFYEAFVKLNLAMMGRTADAALLRRFFTNDGKVQHAVRSFIDYLKQELGVRHLVRAYEKPRLFAKLFEKKLWRDMAYQFALATADLLDEQSAEMQLCFGRGNDNQFDREMRLPDAQEKLAYSRYKSRESPSKHTDPLLQLDALYRKISRQIPVRTSDYTRSSGMPLVHFGRRLPREDEDVSHARIKGVAINESGEIGLRVARHALKHPAEYKVHPRNFPKLKVALLDTSISMALSPDNTGDIGGTQFIPWGDNSKYHFALKGLYGIDNFLEKQGVAPYVQSEAITFGDATERTGRRKMRSEEERRALLKKPEGSTTNINVEVLAEALSDKCLVVSVSDGEICNWNNVKARFREIIAGNDYCHIHIGAANDFTRDLESWGIPVQYVLGNDDLSRLMVDTVSEYYRDRRFT